MRNIQLRIALLLGQHFQLLGKKESTSSKGGKKARGRCLDASNAQSLICFVISRVAIIKAEDAPALDLTNVHQHYLKVALGCLGHGH